MLSRTAISITTVVIVCIALLSFPIHAKAEQGVTVGTTLENLMTAFNGESNANARYLAFAKKADEEGYGQVASLFRAAARAEQVHFEHHAAAIKELGGTPKAIIEKPTVGSTKVNLEAAIAGETYESTKMYPAFLATAKADGNNTAANSFMGAQKTEAVHAGLYKKALSNLNDWKGNKKDFYVCLVCGNIMDRPISRCPICMTPSKKFLLVD